MIAWDWARPGAKCVCIDDTRPKSVILAGVPAVEDGGTFPVRGQVYTVESVVWYESDLSYVQSFLGIHLMEINRPPGKMTGEIVPYRIERFRPLVDDVAKRDVAQFAPLLAVETEDA